MSYDSSNDTMKHIFRVSQFLSFAAKALIDRGLSHDLSKLSDYEKSGFDEYTPKLKKCSYGSEEYKNYLDELGKTLSHHYYENSHHPEHYESGIDGFDLFDLMEMFFDWWAASERHEDGKY